MTHRAGRLLVILQYLRGRRGPATAKDLAREFDVSERTIYRDLNILAGLGAPIEGEAGVGFILRPGYFLPPLSLTETEAAAVLLGLRFVAKRGDPELARAAGTTRAKIAAILDPDTERTMRTAGLTVAPSGSGERERIGNVRKAMEHDRKIRIRYVAGSGAATERIVWPVALGFFDGTEMMAAWCELRDAFRHFRLDRLVSIEVLADRLPMPRRLLLAKYRSEEPDADV